MIRCMFSLVSSTWILGRSVLNGLSSVRIGQRRLPRFTVTRTEQQQELQYETAAGTCSFLLFNPLS
jgi:hypothetical protein